MPILGHIVVKRSGHALNHAFLKKFFASKDSWETRRVPMPDPLPAVQPKSVAI
jgi:UDP-3-O-[3-hydroxymyristoyl] N-acetylglucosamine deacetylase